MATYSWIVAVCSIHLSARAEPEAELDAAEAKEVPAVSRARELYRQASAVARAGAWREARSLYRESYESYPRASTLYNIGYCTAELGDQAAALYYVSRALEMQPGELTEDRRASIVRYRELLVAATAEITLKTSAVAVKATVNGRALVGFGDALVRRFTVAPDGLSGDSSIQLENDARIVLNPGVHRIELAVAGHRELHVVQVTRGQRLELQLSEPSASNAIAAPPPVEPAQTKVLRLPRAPRVVMSKAPPADNAVSPYRVAGVSALAVGGAGLTLALVAGIVTWRTDVRLESRCEAGGVCPPSEAEAVDRHASAATLTNIGLGVGAIAAVTGAGLLIYEHAAQKAKVSLRVLPGQVAVDARF